MGEKETREAALINRIHLSGRPAGRGAWNFPLDSARGTSGNIWVRIPRGLLGVGNAEAAREEVGMQIWEQQRCGSDGEARREAGEAAAPGRVFHSGE